MRKLLLATALLVASLGYATADTLHGYCTGCIDTGSNTPTTIDPLTNFGFLVDPGPQTGNYQLDVLIPNNVTLPSAFTLTGTQGANSINQTAGLFSATPWTSGDLAGYLGISASPNNPIGAYAPDPADTGATGFFVFQINLGTETLASNTSGGSLNLSGGLPSGAYVVAFLEPNGIATANSAAILETGQLSQTPLPPAWAMFMPGIIAGGWWLRRRKRHQT